MRMDFWLGAYMKILKVIAFLLACSFLLGACAPEGVQEDELEGPVAIVHNNDAK